MSNTKIIRERHSWPSSQNKSALPSRDSIDQDPFPHFISPQPEYGDHLIYNRPDITPTLPIARPTFHRSHSLSPDLKKARRFMLHHGPTSSPTFKLKRWIQRMEKRYGQSPTPSPEMIEIVPRDAMDLSPSPSPEEYKVPEPWRPPQEGSPSMSPSVRGRRDLRVGSGRRARRPRAWRAPSIELYTVNEEGEAEGGKVGLGIGCLEEGE